MSAMSCTATTTMFIRICICHLLMWPNCSVSTFPFSIFLSFILLTSVLFCKECSVQFYIMFILTVLVLFRVDFSSFYDCLSKMFTSCINFWSPT